MTSRELASAFWLTVLGLTLVAIAVRNRDVRASLGQLRGLRLPLELLLLLALFAAWLVLVVRAAAELGLWNDTLTKDTVLWFLVPGLGLFVSFADVGQERYVRRRLSRVVGLSALIAFYLNLLTFDIAIEIAIQPLVALLVAAAALADAPERKRVAERLLILLGLALLAVATLNIAANASSIDVRQVGLSWLLPFWLTIVALPFVYLLAVYDRYRVLFRLVDMDAADTRARLRARLALLTSLRGRASELDAVRRSLFTVRQVALAPTFDAARAAIARNQADRRAEAEAERQKADDLKRLAGLTGTDEEGRQLDRREFDETTRALNALAVRQMGWYDGQDGRYGREVLDRMSHHYALSGLPASHGIKMRVSRDGQSWYAWRRTPSGWVFAIGASDPPPAQSHYDGKTVPKGYPGKAPGWDEVLGPNWF